MIYREDCIVIREFTIYPTGAIFDDAELVFKTEELANEYLQRYWYDRYGELNIKRHKDDGTGKLRFPYNYVEVSELGLADGSDVSRRCFTANWCTMIKSKKDML